ncbi:uncharacterized protein [Penaeus vannamei]|uniref:uncharacterized protein n=1 Tax=Penaeus vannamei TaxID=6689 RepID=UPI00387F9C81
MAFRQLWIILFVVGSLSAAPWDGRPGQPTSSPAHFLLHALVPEHNQVRDLTCLECRTAAGVIAAMMAEGATVEEIEDQVILDCVLLDLFPPDVCSGMVRLSGVS